MLTQKQMQDISKILEVLNDCVEKGPLSFSGSLRVSVEDIFSPDTQFIGNIEYESYNGWVYKED